jgi:hypothetical protein
MRRNGWRLFAGATVAVFLAVQPATADDSDADTCAKALSGDVAIAAYTRLITSGRYNGRDLAIIYTTAAMLGAAASTAPSRRYDRF